jgi:membrane protein implicated in regulation of membrane protease activity
MDPTQAASATSVLTALGLGKYAAGIVSLVTFGLAVAAQAMPFLPVPTVTSAAWYRVAYGLLARATGNYRNNAPSPVVGVPAGGIVPQPPAAKVPAP